MRYQLIADGEDWELEKSEWNPTREEILDYAAWLVEMPWHAPEAKANKVVVIDQQTFQVIYEGVRTDHRPKSDLQVP